MTTNSENEQLPAPEVIAEIRDVVKRARQGDASAVPRLREVLKEYPRYWKTYGDLARLAERAWADLAAGADLYLRESLLQQAEAMRAELGGANPSPVVRLLVERVVATWFQTNYFDSLIAQKANTDKHPKLALSRAKQQEQAQRMYLASLAALTNLRKLLPAQPLHELPVAKDETLSRPERNGHGTAYASELPPSVLNRLATYFDQPPVGTTNRQRQPAMAGVGGDC